LGAPFCSVPAPIEPPPCDAPRPWYSFPIMVSDHLVDKLRNLNQGRILAVQENGDVWDITAGLGKETRLFNLNDPDHGG
jgi:hypothetical protein